MLPGLVFSSTMPKIIRLLEMFEQLVKLRESKDEKIIRKENELETLKKKLQTKTLTEAQEMSKLQQAWDDNVKDLKRKNLQMEKDNRNLLAVLSDQAEHSIKEAEFFKNAEEINLLNEKLEKLTHNNQCKDRLIKEHIDNCNALQSQNESFAKINKDLHQKITILQQQSTALISDKNLLESKLKGKLENICRLQHFEKPESKEETPNGSTENNSVPINQHFEDPLIANKLVIDLNDPNRPRYTLQELLEVLNDRNLLKARCFRLEEELIFYKDVARSMGYIDESWEEINAREIKQLKSLYTLNRNKNSFDSQVNDNNGIRKFFSYLTGTDFWGGKRDSNTPQLEKSPQIHRKTKPSTYHETVGNLVNEDEVKEIAPRLTFKKSQDNKVEQVKQSELKEVKSSIS